MSHSRSCRRAALAAGLALTFALVTASTAAAQLVVNDSGDASPSADQLAQTLAGPGVSVSNVTYTGAPTAAGLFSGGTGIIGFDDGVVLSSGSAIGVIGPNVQDGITTAQGTPGDADLDAVVGTASTQDAAVLEFDIVPNASVLTFNYVFTSDEYNEFVSEGVASGVNDVFAFLVNGQNCALVPGTADPVSINTINNGNPFGTVDPANGTVAKNPALYINNDVSDGGGQLDTEMDGLTVVLTCTANVAPGTANHVKLAIADRGDSVLDSNVFLQRASFLSFTPDTVAPGTVIVSGPTGTVPSATPTFAFSASEPSVFECSIDGAAFFACAPPFTTPPLGNGQHTFSVRARDGAGNTGAPVSSTFFVAVSAPGDRDGDAVVDALDNCAAAVNPDQADKDGDRVGDACDASDASGGPTIAKTVIGTVVSGDVFVKFPAGTGPRASARAAQTTAGTPAGYTPIKGAEVLPVGSVVHAVRGRLALTSASAPPTGGGATPTQKADFYDGIFQIRQKNARKPVTDLALRTPDLKKVCGANARSVIAGSFSAKSKKKKSTSKKVASQLWGDGKGAFRTTGRHSAATVRGTKWLTQERCDGTLTRVTSGVVRVFDKNTKKTVTVRAGRSYLARAARATVKTKTP